jgi:hypothetical protein
MGDRVLAVAPGFINPVGDAAELEITGRDQGRFVIADGYSSYGEPVRRVRNRSGKVAEVWLAASKLLPEEQVANEIEVRYANSMAAKAARRRSPRKSTRRA